jgi:hypothetical protein
VTAVSKRGTGSAGHIARPTSLRRVDRPASRRSKQSQPLPRQRRPAVGEAGQQAATSRADRPWQPPPTHSPAALARPSGQHLRSPRQLAGPRPQRPTPRVDARRIRGPTAATARGTADVVTPPSTIAATPPLGSTFSSWCVVVCRPSSSSTRVSFVAISSRPTQRSTPRSNSDKRRSVPGCEERTARRDKPEERPCTWHGGRKGGDARVDGCAIHACRFGPDRALASGGNA